MRLESEKRIKSKSSVPLPWKMDEVSRLVKTANSNSSVLQNMLEVARSYFEKKQK